MARGSAAPLNLPGDGTTTSMLYTMTHPLGSFTHTHTRLGRRRQSASVASAQYSGASSLPPPAVQWPACMYGFVLGSDP